MVFGLVDPDLPTPMFDRVGAEVERVRAALQRSPQVRVKRLQLCLSAGQQGVRVLGWRQPAGRSISHATEYSSVALFEGPHRD
jgi:hypothetical protein